MKRYIISCIFFILSISAWTQTTFNIELQAYPTGLIPGFRIENQLTGKNKIHLRVGLNLFNHRDLGVHDEETGNGYGFTMGWSKQIKTSKFDLGFRNDVWFNTVNWCDGVDAQKKSGQTKIIVLQPTAELTYASMNTNLLNIKPTLSVGMEWNIRTEGEPTGEGPIILLGVIISKNKK